MQLKTTWIMQKPQLQNPPSAKMKQTVDKTKFVWQIKK